MIEMYVFDDLATYQAAINYINSTDWFPYSNFQDESKQKTLIWVDPNKVNQRSTDGKYYFKRIPEKFINQLTQEQIDYFKNTFNHTIELYSDDWEQE